MVATLLGDVGVTAELDSITASGAMQHALMHVQYPLQRQSRNSRIIAVYSVFLVRRHSSGFFVLSFVGVFFRQRADQCRHQDPKLIQIPIKTIAHFTSHTRNFHTISPKILQKSLSARLIACFKYPLTINPWDLNTKPKAPFKLVRTQQATMGYTASDSSGVLDRRSCRVPRSFLS